LEEIVAFALESKEEDKHGNQGREDPPYSPIVKLGVRK